MKKGKSMKGLTAEKHHPRRNNVVAQRAATFFFIPFMNFKVKY